VILPKSNNIVKCYFLIYASKALVKELLSGIKGYPSPSIAIA